MKRVTVKVLLACVGVVIVFSGTNRAAAESSVDPVKLFHESYERAKKIRDFTANFTKREQIKDSLQPLEKTEMKFRQRPFSVYLKWTERHKGREVIYVKNKYKGKIVGHQPIGPLNFKKESDPNSPYVREHSRRTPADAGFENSMKLIVDVTELAKKRDDLSITYLGTETFDNRPVHVVVRTLPVKKKEYPIYVLLVYIDKELMIPVKVVGYDWDYRLLGYYAFTNIKVNVGLTDKDFDIENPAYDFPGILPFTAPKLAWPFGEKKEE